MSKPPLTIDNMSSEFRESFWQKVAKAAGCWPWIAAKLPSGYGRISFFRRPVYAHHVALILDGKPRPSTAIALHSCDNPSCVNPEHLSWGTQQENMRQAIARGRAPHEGRVAGERNGNALLTAVQVLEIREATGPQLDIAARYGISRQLVSAIKTHAAWRHL